MALRDEFCRGLDRRAVRLPGPPTASRAETADFDFNIRSLRSRRQTDLAGAYTGDLRGPCLAVAASIAGESGSSAGSKVS